MGTSSSYHDDDYDHYAGDDGNEEQQAEETAESRHGSNGGSEVGRVEGVVFDSVAVVGWVGDDEEVVGIGHVEELVLRLIVQGRVDVN